MEGYSMKTLQKTFVKKFNAHLYTYQFLLNKEVSGGSLNLRVSTLRRTFNEALIKAKKDSGYVQGDKIRIIARNDGFHHPISTETSSDITVDNIMDHIEKIVTSNQKINVHGTTFDIQVFRLPRGSGSEKKILNLSEDLRSKRSITRINNSDSICGARAIITALTYHTDEILGVKLSLNDIKQIRKGRQLQTILAEKLCVLLEGHYEQGFSIEDIKQAEGLLDIQIKVICAESLNSLIYSGPENPVKIYLYKNKNHFDVINSITGIYGRSYYCHKCDAPYYHDKDRGHKCKNSTLCKLCNQMEHVISSRNKVFCSKCNRLCYNAACLEKHSSVCSEIYKCTGCNKVLRRDKFHKCGYSLCNNCEEFVEIANHQCYMTQKRGKGGFCKVPCTCNSRSNDINKGCRYKKGNNESPICKEDCICNGLSQEKISRCTYTEKYIFFDFEATQNTGMHIPNLVVAHDFAGNKFIFKNNEEFCKWLISKEHTGYTAIAHNAKGYDSYFILKYCVENTVKPYTIYAGSKLMLLEIPQIKLKIIDSSNFVAGPLSEFPKTFGLCEVRKGFFPHFFNTVENQDYEGSIPDIEYYGPGYMKVKQRTDFLKWHAERRAENYLFDFQKEIHAYCDSDVDILRRGCLVFRDDFLKIANIDPFCYLTIASVCMGIFRSKYMPTNTIAVVKVARKDTYSKASITWLNQFPNVRHALKGGEVLICGIPVDGYNEISNTVYQYHGCYWHGCPKCYASSTINSVNHETMGDLYEKTLDRSSQIKESGYNLIETWECVWLNSKEYKNTPPIGFIEPLKPRESFFGGRTNAAKLKVSGNKMKYIDVVSLYPTVQYFDFYPIGHPIKIYKADSYDSTWFGLVKCVVLPPRALYHPVLPVKTTKLTFALCRTCMETLTEICTHSDSERCFTGTWTTLELNKAIEKGYKILKIEEVWHFEKKTNILFRSYVNDFMKIKLETSPHNYESNAAYATAIKQQMGLELDNCKIKCNPGMRSLAKICLNSLWGKFGQRQNMSQTEYIVDPKKWYEILLNDTLDISNCLFLNENMVQVTYKYKDLFYEDDKSTNIFIASFTTSNARLRLYDMLDKLGEAVVYYDTDSIVYIDNGKNTIPTGEMLGEWSDELGDDDFITDWLSTGPKSYYYKTIKGKEVTKIKGFTLNYDNSLVLTAKSLRNVIDKPSTKIPLINDKIERDTTTKDIITRKRVSKTFGMDYKKRKIADKADEYILDTFPWGF